MTDQQNKTFTTNNIQGTLESHLNALEATRNELQQKEQAKNLKILNLSAPTVFPDYNLKNSKPEGFELTEIKLKPLLLMHVQELNTDKTLDSQEKQTMRLLQIVTGLSANDVLYLAVQDLAWLLEYIFNLLKPMRAFLEKSQTDTRGV